MRRLRTFALAGIVALAAGGAAVADVIWVGSGPGRGLKQDVNIQGSDGDALVYLLNGNRASTPFERVLQIEYDDEPQLTAAEAAYAAGQWQEAAQAYEEVVRRNNTQWVRRRAATRLVASAAAAGAFDQAVSGFIALAEIEPAAAAGAMPKLTDAVTAEQLADASAAVNRALSTPASNGAVRQRALLTFLLQLEVRRGNEQAADAVIARLDGVMPDQPGESERDRQLFAEVTLAKARRLLDGGDPAAATALIREQQAVFEDPILQSEALFLLARSAEAAAAGDRTRLLDSALGYMKVVALFKNASEHPNVPEALLRAGMIHEQLGLADDAAKLYRSLIERHGDSSAAAQAQARLDAAQPQGDAPEDAAAQ